MAGGWMLLNPLKNMILVHFQMLPYQKLQPLINQTTDTIVAVPNSYPLYTVGGVADNQRATRTSKRIFILTRSGYIGQQRYAIVWSGDITSSWQVMKTRFQEL